MAQPSQAETLPVDELFRAPEFIAAFSGWRQACLIKKVKNDRLVSYLSDFFGNGERSVREVGESVEMAIGQLASEDSFYDEEAEILYEKSTEAERIMDEARAELLRTGTGLGVGQFALYGLYAHTRGGYIKFKDLQPKAKQSEQDFEIVDRFVRSNAGSVLTTYGIYGFQSARLGVGGIKLRNNDYAVVPIADGTYAYGMTDFEKRPQLYVEKDIQLIARSIHSVFGNNGTRIYESWDSYMAVFGQARDSLALVLGDPTEQYPTIAENDDKSFNKMLYFRMKTVATAAMRGSAEGLGVEVYSSDSSTIS